MRQRVDEDPWDVPEPTATLVLDQPPYVGGVIELRLGLSPMVYFGVQHWLSQLDGSGETPLVAAQELGKLFAEHGLDSWNLRFAKGPRKGEPIPATEAGVLGLDMRLLLKIASEWFAATGTVGLPLPDASVEAPSPPRLNERRRASTRGGQSEDSAPKPSTATSPASSESAA